MVKLNMNWVKAMIRSSSVNNWGIRLNVIRIISNAFKVSLTKSFPVAQGKKMTAHFYNNSEFWTGKKIKITKLCPLTSRYFDPCSPIYEKTFCKLSFIHHVAVIRYFGQREPSFSQNIFHLLFLFLFQIANWANHKNLGKCAI